MNLFKRIFLRTFPFLALLMVGLSVLVQLKFAVMGDKGWLMHAAEEWVSGKKLYTDIFEVNPPLILWLYGACVWVARHCYFLQDYAAIGLMGLCLTALSIRLGAQLIGQHPAFEGNRYLQASFVLLLATSFIFLTSPVYFADREHIMLVLAFPYMLRFAPSLARKRFPASLRVMIGLCAAVGFFIKLHAMVVFAVLQVFYLAKDRSPFVLMSLENRIIYALGAFYAGAVLFTTPEYYTVVLPMALETYADFNVKGSIHNYLPLALSGLVIPFLDFRTRFSTPYRPEVYYFLVIIVLYALYALLNNGWGYTYHPLFSILFILTCWLYWEYDWLKKEHAERGLPTRPFEFGMRATRFCLGINWVYGALALQVQLLNFTCGGYTGCEDNAIFDRYIRDNRVRSFGLMSAEFTRWPEIARETGTRWDTRFNHLWMLPALNNDGKGPAASQGWIMHYVGNAYAHDLDTRRPDIVFVDNSQEFFTNPNHIDILGILGKAPAFAAAWSHYTMAASIDRCESNTSDKEKVYHAREGCRYDIYKRTDAPGQ